MTPSSSIGIFDSGVGGLSVLPALRRAAPDARILYVADSGHAPYGERDVEFVIERSQRIARFLLQRGAQLLLVACNTATAAAAQALREAHPDTLIVGIEPGLKPAVGLTRNRRVGVMATSLTLASAKFQRLLLAQAYGIELHLQACPGLADAIESGDLQSPGLRALVQAYCEPLRRAQVDVVALGCTHYPFVRELILEAMGRHVVLVDTAEAVVRHSITLMRGVPEVTLGDGDERPLQLWSSGDPQRLAAFARRWLGLNLPAFALPALA